MAWSYSILMNKGYVELFIDRGSEKKAETDQIYQTFLNDKERIETDFGEPLCWDKKEGRQICRIKSFCNLGGLKDDEIWGKIQHDMIDRMKRLENALKPVFIQI